MSPLVQSGDMSHPTKRIIGDIIAESTARAILIVPIISLYNFTVAAEDVFFSSGAQVLGVISKVFINPVAGSFDAYVVFHSYDIPILLV